MTEIAFHFNVSHKIDYLVRLVRKALKSGAEVAVRCETAHINLIDENLWSAAPIDFLAHAIVSSDEHLSFVSPITLGESCLDAPHRNVVINMADDIPEGFSQFDRLVEIVGAYEDDRQKARLRWKYYADRGYSLVRHDIATAKVST